MMRISLRVLLIAGAAVALPAALVAHEVPAHVHVTGLIRPDGNRLRVLVRVPLNAMRDMEFPLYGAGFLDIANTEPVLRDAALLWVAGSMQVYENDEPLSGIRIASVRVSLPSDLSFGTWSSALAHVTSPADPRLRVPWEQAMLDVLLEYPIASADSRFAVNAMFAHLGMRTTTELRFEPLSGEPRSYTFSGNARALRLNPAWHQVASRFFRAGAAAVGGSLQLWLLIACAVAGFRRIDQVCGLYLPLAAGALLPLLAGAMGVMPTMLWVEPAVDLLIAMAIFLLALETIIGPRFTRRARAAFAAGAIAGASLWYTLDRSLQFAAGQDVVGVLLYTAGVQAALFVVAGVAAGLYMTARAERVTTIVVCALLAHTGWHWVLERGAALRGYEVSLSLGSYGWLQIARGVILVAMFAIIAGVGYVGSRRLAPAGVRANATEGAGD